MAASGIEHVNVAKCIFEHRTDGKICSGEFPFFLRQQDRHSLSLWSNLLLYGLKRLLAPATQKQQKNTQLQKKPRPGLMKQM